MKERTEIAVFSALLKKQLRGFFSSFLGRGKKRAGKGKVILFALLFVYLFLFFGFVLYGMGKSLALPLHEAGLGWLYFAIAALLSLALGVIGSVFTAEAELFEAKDNELLLSMPIPSWMILASRMLGLYVQSFLFGTLVLLPMDIAYFTEVSAGAAAMVLSALLLFLLPFLTLTLTVLLGWLVALVTKRMRNKSLFTMILSLALLVGYYFLYFRMNNYLTLLLENSGEVAASVRVFLFPLYLFGRASEGALLPLLSFVGILLLVFGLVYALLAATFRKIAAARPAVRTRYKRKHLAASGQLNALFRKELRHFLASPIYMLNCGIGSLFLLVLSIAAVIKGQAFLDLLRGSIPSFDAYMSLFAAAFLCFLAGMNYITAPSVSLECRQISLLRSFPLETRRIFDAKILLHVALTAPFVLAAGVVFDFVLRPGLLMVFLIPLCGLAATLFFALSGLAFNLLFPKFDWISEAVAVKQSFSTVIAVFFNMGIVILFAILFYLVRAYVSAALYLTLVLAILLLLSALVYLWLQKRGKALFERF